MTDRQVSTFNKIIKKECDLVRYKDKLNQGKYILNKIKEEIPKLLVETKSVHRFRYEIVSFFSVMRSVTWVIQKDLKKHSNFKKWYEDIVLKKLRPFKNTIDIRNVLEKEGNRFPLFVFFYETVDGKVFEITWDYSGDDVEQLVGFGGEFPVFIPESVTDEDLNKINCEIYGGITKLVMENVHTSKIKEVRLIFEDITSEDNIEKKMTIEKFEKFVDDYFEVMKEIVEEAEKFRI